MLGVPDEVLRHPGRRAGGRERVQPVCQLHRPRRRVHGAGLGRQRHPRQRHPLLPRRHRTHHRGVHRHAGHHRARAQHEGAHQRRGWPAHGAAVHPVPHVRDRRRPELPHRVRAEAVLRRRHLTPGVLLDHRAHLRPRLVRPGVALRRDDGLWFGPGIQRAHHHVRVRRVLELRQVLRPSLTRGVARAGPAVLRRRVGAHRGKCAGPGWHVQGAAAVLSGSVDPGSAAGGSKGRGPHPVQG